ncbi:MAG: glycoside hydrolase family 38 C-terminal domain-containing protein, partial [bacterium]
FRQYLSVIEGMPMLYERIEADWHESHRMAKLKFNFAAKNDTVWYDIPYAAIPRKSIPVDPFDRAKTEHCGQKWADFSDASGDFGVTILNTAKYGYDAKESAIRMSLLRAPLYPDPYADRGLHEIEYAFEPHVGDWKSSDAPRKGSEFNYALLPLMAAAHEGKLPAAYSFYSAEPENVALAAVKKAEDDSNLVLRIVETEGKDSKNAVIKLPFTPKSISEINLIEDAMANGKPGTIKGNSIVVPLNKFEIKTIKLTK